MCGVCFACPIKVYELQTTVGAPKKFQFSFGIYKRKIILFLLHFIAQQSDFCAHAVLISNLINLSQKIIGRELYFSFSEASLGRPLCSLREYVQTETHSLVQIFGWSIIG